MEVTLVIPMDEGYVDTDGYVSGGIEVYPGRLSLEQIEAATRQEGYPEQAVMVKRDDKGQVEHVHVTFHNDEGAVPTHVSEDGCEGAVFEDESGVGKLSFLVRFTTMSKLASG